MQPDNEPLWQQIMQNGSAPDTVFDDSRLSMDGLDLAFADGFAALTSQLPPDVEEEVLNEYDGLRDGWVKEAHSDALQIFNQLHEIRITSERRIAEQAFRSDTLKGVYQLRGELHEMIDITHHALNAHFGKTPRLVGIFLNDDMSTAVRAKDWRDPSGDSYSLHWVQWTPGTREPSEQTHYVLDLIANLIPQTFTDTLATATGPIKNFVPEDHIGQPAFSALKGYKLLSVPVVGEGRGLESQSAHIVAFFPPRGGWVTPGVVAGVERIASGLAFGLERMARAEDIDGPPQ